jgi:hypothetical protein
MAKDARFNLSVTITMIITTIILSVSSGSLKELLKLEAFLEALFRYWEIKLLRVLEMKTC